MPSRVVASWPWVIAMALVLAAVFAIALRRGEQRRTAGRAARATTAAVVVVVVLASALVVWQLPLARGAGFDPIVALAPAVAADGGGPRGARGVRRRRRGVVPAGCRLPVAAARVPARQVARRLPIYAVAVLLVTLTVAQAVFASAYTATWQAMTTDSAAVRAGADLRVDMTPQTASPGRRRGRGRAGNGCLVLGVHGGDRDRPPRGRPGVGAVRADRAGRDLGGRARGQAALIAAADATGDGVVVSDPVSLGDGATGVAVTVDLTVESGSLPASAWWRCCSTPRHAGHAAPHRRTAPAADGTATLVATAELPEGASPWRLLAIGAGTGPSIAGSSVGVELSEVVVAGGGPLDGRAPRT